jgi:enoyl-CoA hydratase/carnithine racemase
LTTQLVETLAAADTAPAVRAVVLAGEGRAFCAGADLGEFAELTPANQAAVLRRADLTCRLHAMLPDLSKPIVAAVQGAAMGGGAGLAIGCDMVVAAADLRLGYPELRHSMVPALVMTSLQRQLGRKAAFELISLGRTLEAEAAMALGLVNRVVAVEALLPAAREIALAWAKVNPAAMAATKALFYRVADLPFAAAMQAGRDVNALMRGFREERKA